MELDKIKNYLRIDYDEDDNLILSIKESAEIYLENAGVKGDCTNNLYCLAVLMLTAHWYENRNIVAYSNVTAIEMMLNPIILQLQIKNEANNGNIYT